jgi:UDP-glucuronate 4-epimerase
MILVTGCDGFIGYHLCHALLDGGEKVIGVDRSYGVHAATLASYSNFQFERADLRYGGVMWLITAYQIETVIHLAARAGVRESLQAPIPYIDDNILGTVNVLEAVRRSGFVQHLIYASSSSVNGGRPLNPYGASKLACEALAGAWTRAWGVRSTGLRFHTVYGPQGREDMAPMIFARALLHGGVIKLRANGAHLRDWTYVDDAVAGILATMTREKGDLAGVYDLGSGHPESTLRFLHLLADHLAATPKYEIQATENGEMQETRAHPGFLQAYAGFKCAVPLHEGIRRFAEWCIESNLEPTA